MSTNVDIELTPESHIHLVGIGGSGLSAIAWVLIGRGYKISGSDKQPNEQTAGLAKAGAIIYRGHDQSQIKGADILLASSAIPDENPEIQAANVLGIPVFKREKFLKLLLKDCHTIAVAGTHGKTTTTGMVAQILIKAGLDPSVIVGGVLPILGRNGLAGDGDYFVIEADEYDGMFLGLAPHIAIITNVEYDHPDQFPTVDVYRKAFLKFIETINHDGGLYICIDDEDAALMAEEAGKTVGNVVRYGLAQSEIQALDLRQNQLGGTDFLVQENSKLIGLARLRVPGIHNVQNALAATAVALQLGVDFHTIQMALAEFGGIGRRFQVIGEISDVSIIDDYAHHPTEIRTTLAAARQRFPGRRLWAVWQPHTYSRTKQLLTSFSSSFADADKVIVLDIFASRETDTLGINAEDVAAHVKHANVQHVGGVDESAAYILERVRPGDVVVTLTAGDGNRVGQLILVGLRKRMNGNSKPGGVALDLSSEAQSASKFA